MSLRVHGQMMHVRVSTSTRRALAAECLCYFPRRTQSHTCAEAPVCTRDSIRKRPCQEAQRSCQVQLELVWPAQFQLVLDAALGPYLLYAACNRMLGLISYAATVALVCLCANRPFALADMLLRAVAIAHLKQIHVATSASWRERHAKT